MVVNIYRHRTKDFLTESSKNNYERTSGQLTICTTTRAVKKFLTSRLVMNSRQLWNSHQRNKFLRAEASKDILQFRVLEMGFLGVFKRYFPLRTPSYFVRIHARLRDERSTLQGDATFLLGPVWDNTKAAHLEVGRRVEWARHLAPWHLLGQVLIDNQRFVLLSWFEWVGRAKAQLNPWQISSRTNLTCYWLEGSCNSPANCSTCNGVTAEAEGVKLKRKYSKSRLNS